MHKKTSIKNDKEYHSINRFKKITKTLNIDNMILTTTNSVEDYKILEYLGIVSGTAANMQKNTLTFNMQKYYEGISESVTEVKEKAFAKLKANAEKLNANAVIGINIEIELSNSSIIIVAVTGTAVSIMKR